MAKNTNTIIYISGKITGLDKKQAKILFNKAKQELQIKYPNAGVLNPMDIELGSKAKWDDYMRADIRLLMEANTIYMLRNHKDSKGAMLELKIARELGFEIIYEN